MGRYLCQLCYTLVQCGDRHPCFFYKDDETFYILPEVDETEMNIKHDEMTGKRAANSNENYGDGWKSAQNIGNCRQASNSRVDSVLSVGNEALGERPLELEKDFTNRLVQPDASFPAPSGSRKIDAGENQPLDSKKDSDAQLGPSTIRPDSVGPDRKEQYVCPLCPMQFIHKRSLLDHYATHAFICDTCGKRFTQKAALYRHARRHTGEKPYICRKEFNRKNNLDEHLRRHTGEKPFICDTCEKRFIHKRALITHTRVHSGKKLFICDTCGKRFTQKAALFRHARRHTGEKPFACDSCGKEFYRKDNLYSHLRMHNGEKRFLCNICGAAFSDPMNHRRHVQTHYRGNHFRCGECGETFSSNGDRNRHCRENHQ